MFGCGPVDFAIEYRGAALMMTTEAKKEDMDQGFAQCIHHRNSTVSSQSALNRPPVVTSVNF